ncbi:MAG: hypothetical protein V2A74_14800, partial [bacterium]
MVLECRRHWLVLVKPVLVFLVFAIATFIAFKYSPQAGKILLLISIIPLLVLVWKMLDRRTDIWIVTNLRVIDEWGVLSRNAKESP